jgi:hypothetical protein
MSPFFLSATALSNFNFRVHFQQIILLFVALADPRRSEAANSSRACIAPVKLSCQRRKLNRNAEANIAARTAL